MLPSFMPWFYWNFVGSVRDKLLNVFYKDLGYELISTTYKSTMWGREHYPVENPPGSIETITRALEHLGVFDRAISKLLNENNYPTGKQYRK